MALGEPLQLVSAVGCKRTDLRSMREGCQEVFESAGATGDAWSTPRHLEKYRSGCWREGGF
jgi:hypothetical protein